MNFEHQGSFICWWYKFRSMSKSQEKKRSAGFMASTSAFSQLFALVSSRLVLFKELFLYKMVIVAIVILDYRNNFWKGRENAMEHNKRLTCMFLFMMCGSTKEQVSMVIGTPFYVPVLMLDSNWHLNLLNSRSMESVAAFWTTWALSSQAAHKHTYKQNSHSHKIN